MQSESTMTPTKTARFSELFKRRESRLYAVIGVTTALTSLMTAISAVQVFVLILHPPEGVAMWRLVVMLAGFLVAAISFGRASRESFHQARRQIKIADNAALLKLLKGEYKRRFGPLPPHLE